MSEHEAKGGAAGKGGGGHEEHDKKKGHGHKKHGHGHAKHEEHEEGVPEWVVSFADNALLQMGFFVIMFAMNVGAKATSESDQNGNQAGTPAGMLDMMIAIREAFNSPVSPFSDNPSEQILVQRIKQKLAEGDANQVGPTGDKPNLQGIDRGTLTNINGTVAFEQGSTDVGQAGRTTCRQVAKELRGTKYVIEIRGHVSALEAAAGVDAAMSLSYKRAQAVASVLVENGMAWSQLRLVACADNDRINPTAYDTPSHRSNQRAEIVVTADTIASDPHMREPGR